MKSNISAALTAFSLFTAAYAAPPSSSGWTMVFNDEFEGNSLDKSKWNPTYNWGHTHNHQAYCVEENVSVKDGKLIIRADARRHPEAPATCSNGGKTYSLDYTSGAIDTRGHFEVNGGYIEGRFKMPWQLGTWPAFWTLQDGWPPEIDIFEVPHERNLHHYYLHYTKTDWYASHGSAWDHEASFGGTHTGPDKSADFHTYGLEWTSSYLKFYFDDKVIATYNRPTEISQLKGNYIIINLAVGGWAGDNIQVTNANPAYLECDWVRVWKKDASEMIPSDKIKVMSVSEGKCMSGVTGDLSLVDCNSDDAWINLFEQYSGTFRLNISGKVLEIGGESKEDGAKAGIWDWNGGGHQQFAFEKQPNYTANVVTMMARHSEKYLQVGKDGTIFQAPLPDDKSALWRIFQPGEEIVTSADGLKCGDQVRFIDNKLVWNGEEQQKMLVEVYDSRGVCCMVDEIGGGKTEVSLQMLPTGIYFVTINGGMMMKIRI